MKKLKLGFTSSNLMRAYAQAPELSCGTLSFFNKFLCYNCSLFGIFASILDYSRNKSEGFMSWCSQQLGLANRCHNNMCLIIFSFTADVDKGDIGRWVSYWFWLVVERAIKWRQKTLGTEHVHLYVFSMETKLETEIAASGHRPLLQHLKYYTKVFPHLL